MRGISAFVSLIRVRGPHEQGLDMGAVVHVPVHADAWPAGQWLRCMCTCMPVLGQPLLHLLAASGVMRHCALVCLASHGCSILLLAVSRNVARLCLAGHWPVGNELHLDPCSVDHTGTPQPVTPQPVIALGHQGHGCKKAEIPEQPLE